jgi:hypothetical protein
METKYEKRQIFINFRPIMDLVANAVVGRLLLRHFCEAGSLNIELQVF